MDKKGYIYILTNDSFHKSNWIKIGYATDVEKRAKELSGTAVPLPYEIYATYEIPLSEKMADKALHNLIHRLNPTLKIAPNREFFEIEPWDALELLQSMAIIHNRLDKLVRYKENKVGLDSDEEIKEEYTIEALIEDGGKVKQLYEKLKTISKEVILDYTIKPTKNYIAFKRNKKHNIISLWPKENAIEVVLNAKLGTIKDESGTLYDISNRLWSSAQYAFRFDENSDQAIVKNLILQTYQNLSKF